MLADESLERIANEVRVCLRCSLSSGRKNCVPGEGPHSAKVVIIGEAPGKNEDSAGRPFVGQAGRILDEALLKAGIERSGVFITNIVKCRPPRNRVPKKEESAACIHYLERQISIIGPNIICILGATAYSTILHGRSIMKNRGKIIEKNGQDYLITIHPAAAMYNRGLRSVLINDISKLTTYL